MTEAELHRAVAAFLRVALPPEVVCTAIQPEGRGPKVGALMKARGVLPGMPDFVILASVNGQARHCGIELKAPAGRLSSTQREMHARLHAVHMPVAICRSVEDVQTALTGWGIPLRARLDGRPAC